MTQTTAKANVVNGVNVDRLVGTIEAIQQQPSLAKFQFRSRNRWLSGGHNRSTIKEFHGAGQEDASRTRAFVIDADEPDVLLGLDQGANPVEYVLHALAACVTTAMVCHAAARGIHIEEVESRLEGDLDVQGLLGMSDQVRNGYEEIRFSFRIKADVPDDQLAELIELGTKYSPVFDIISNGVPVKVGLMK
jgi:uncharacterized OsmC-like protein